MPYHLIGGVKTISKNIFSAQESERSRLFDPEFTTPFLFFFFKPSVSEWCSWADHKINSITYKFTNRKKLFTYFSFTIIIELDGIFLQFSHQVICGHEAKIFVSRSHLNESKQDTQNISLIIYHFFQKT